MKALTLLCKILPVCGILMIFGATAQPAQAWFKSGGGVPEIDPNAIGGALTVLSGGLLMLTDRFRK